MAKFVKVDSSPEQLDKDCIVIDAPNFKAEILACAKKKPRNGLMAPNYMREIFAAIGAKYGDERFNALTSLSVSQYKGVPCNDSNEVEALVNRAVKENYPLFLDSYVDYHLKKRPNGTKLIYFLGNFTQTGAFAYNGVDEIKVKEIDVYLGKKQKKVVGKPAITNDEAAASK